MSVYHCHPARGPLTAAVTPPGSKSITNRALIAAALADGDSVLSNFLFADDTSCMIEALRGLGIAITIDEAGGTVEITGCRGHIPASEAKLFCGNSGTTMRFCTAMVATGHGRFELDGMARMRERPIGALVDALRSLGTGIEYTGEEGKPPLVVHASGMRGGRLSFTSAESSQPLSGLLMAAPIAQGDVLIEVHGDVPSQPYLRMTTAVMDRFGVSVLADGATRAGQGQRLIVAAPQRYLAASLEIEPDASNATYFLAAPAIAGGRVTVERLGTASIQGDIAFVDVLERMGCFVERSADRLTVHGPRGNERLRGIDVDLNDMPDTVQTLAVLALFAEGPTVIRNVANLRVKETDRLAALSCELTKLGAHVDVLADGLRITPPTHVRAAAIDTYDDHRMAMSFALVGLSCSGIVINNAECCRKTFPDFFQRLEQLSRHAP